MLAEHGGRTVRIRELPIGIPFSLFETMARSAPPKSLSLVHIKIILGVDRLDYTKGNKL
jgi:trehalose-6-phosphate synthase